MLDIFFSPVNTALSILVILLIIYWLFSLFSGLDFDVDFDVDVDVDVDIDVDADFDTTAPMETSSVDDALNTEVNKEDVLNKRQRSLKWWQVFLIYFNFVGLPFMFTFTCLVFFWWLISVGITGFMHLHDTQFGFLIMALSFIPAIFVSKIFSNPFKSFFKKLNKDGDAPVDFVGRQGTSLSNIKDKKMGSGKVVIEGNPYSIYIKSENGEPIAYNENFLIIRQGPEKTYFYVQSYKNNY